MLRSLSVTALSFVMVACATQGSSSKPASNQNSEMQSKINAEPPTNTSEEIARRGAEAFINAPGLTDEQKQKLLGVFNRTYAEAMEIKGEIGKSKSLMFKLVVSKKFKSKEVEDLKKHIVALDQKRLNIMFKALADVQEIVGTGDEKEEIYKHFYDFEYPRSVLTQR